MPWKASSEMEERPRFVARLLDDEARARIIEGFRQLREGSAASRNAPDLSGGEEESQRLPWP